jgi:hypothetical protein
MSMDRGEHVWSAHSMGAMQVVEGPVVDRADPFDAESPTTDLSRVGRLRMVPAGPPDPLVPAAGTGLIGWLSAFRFALRRVGPSALPIALFAAVPAYFFVGRVDDTVVIMPALFDLVGVFGLVLLPLMWLAYFSVSALPLVISVAGVAGTAVPAAATSARPRPGRVFGLVANRLRPLWVWFAAFGVVTQALPLLLTADRLGPAVAVPLAIGLGLLSTAVFTFTGLLGCVLLIERGQGPRRASYLCGRTRLGGLIAASGLLTVLPGVVGGLAGHLGSTLATAAGALLWAAAALVTYAEARSTEGPVTSTSLCRELATPEE